MSHAKVIDFSTAQLIEAQSIGLVPLETKVYQRADKGQSKGTLPRVDFPYPVSIT